MPVDGPGLAVGIAQHANLHETIPGCSIRGGLEKISLSLCSYLAGKRREGRVSIHCRGKFTHVIGRNQRFSCPLRGDYGRCGRGRLDCVMLRRSPFTPVQSALYALNYVLARVLWRVQIQRLVSHPARPGCGRHLQPPLPAGTLVHGADDPRAITGWSPENTANTRPSADCWNVRGNSRSPRSSRYGGHPRGHSPGPEGELVGMFPEGRINTTDQLLLPGRSGAALIALKARAPVVPCYILYG